MNKLSKKSMETLILSFNEAEENKLEKALWEVLKKEDPDFYPFQYALYQLLNLYLLKASSNHPEAAMRVVFYLKPVFHKKSNLFEINHPTDKKHKIKITESEFKNILEKISAVTFEKKDNMRKQVKKIKDQILAYCKKQPIADEKPEHSENSLESDCKLLLERVRACKCDIQELIKRSQQNIHEMAASTFSLANRLGKLIEGEKKADGFREEIKDLQKNANMQHEEILKTSYSLEAERLALLQNQTFSLTYKNKLTRFLKKHETFVTQKSLLTTHCTQLKELKTEIFKEIGALKKPANTTFFPFPRQQNTMVWRALPPRPATVPTTTLSLSQRVIAPPAKQQPNQEFTPYRLFY